MQLLREGVKVGLAGDLVVVDVVVEAGLAKRVTVADNFFRAQGDAIFRHDGGGLDSESQGGTHRVADRRPRVRGW